MHSAVEWFLVNGCVHEELRRDLATRPDAIAMRLVPLQYLCLSDCVHDFVAYGIDMFRHGRAP
eukprot:4841999-Lingulodinium_polyedra.AAC.1